MPVAPRLIALLTLGTAVGVPAYAPAHKPIADSAKPRHVKVVAGDYFFQAPDTLPAGPTVFQLENRGKMAHEVAIFAARQGISAAEMLAAATPEERRARADPPVGVLFTPLGHPLSAELGVTLERGHWYWLFCALRDSTGMPPHFQIGMVDSVFAR